MTLHLLASRLGIATSYTGAWGEQVHVTDATLIAVCAAMGIPTETHDWIAAAHHALDAQDAAEILAPVVVAWDGRIDVDTVLARVPDRTTVTLTDEEGTDRTVLLHTAAPLPYGYHSLTAGPDTALVISAPRRLPAPEGRGVCVFAPLFALRPAEPVRGPDLRELDELVTWAAAHGATGVLTLPLLASFLDPPAEPSPYAPASRAMWNDLYAVVDRPAVDTHGPTIDYDALAAASEAGLAATAAALDQDPFAAGAFLRYLAAHPEVGHYARFRAAGERHGRDWRRWPTALRDGTIETTDVDPTRVHRHAVGQWLVQTQLEELAARARARGVVLGLDLAVGCHRDSFDVWAHQDEFATGCSVGAPPDTFFPGGQVWGFPPPHPVAARRSGYRDLRAALAHHLRVASLLRIDHVLGLRRLFWVPDGAPAAAGTYVFTPLDEQLAVVGLEAHRAGATVVGENLGLVPPEIDAALAEHGLLGMTVAYGALEDPARAGRPLTAPVGDVAMFGTHDMATFAGFVAATDCADRVALGLGDPADAHDQAARRHTAIAAAAAARGVPATAAGLYGVLAAELAASPAPWVTIALEDLWDEREPHNVPGTSTERPNWRRRAAHPLTDLPPGTEDRFGRIIVARGVAEQPADRPS
jgi:4-alpha-glucanotransferase